jgi:hypothetical protein
VELYLSTAISQLNVYYDGQMIPKMVSPDGRTLTVRIPATASGSGYFDLCGDGGCVAATEPFVVTPTSATVTLNNNSGRTVCFVYISPSTQSTWGEDWLGPFDIVNSGFSYVFYVPPGTYDLKAEDCSHGVIDIRWNVSLSGAYFWNVGP